MTGKTLLLAFAALTLVSVSLTFEVSRGQSTCLECRATWQRVSIGGFDRSYIEINDYSQVVLQSDPAHQHDWRSSGSATIESLIGKTFVCGRPHPIWVVPVIYHAAHARTVAPVELAATLRAIDSKDKDAALAAAERMATEGADAYLRTLP